MLLNVGRQPWAFRRLLAATILATGLLLTPISAFAEIIVDDFDDPFELVLPDMDGEYLVQTGIGPLDAERWSQLNASSGSRPIGRADANITQSSALTFELDRINPHPIGGPPAIAINLLYSFDETDITQSGINDRIAVDFAYLRSAIPLAQVTVFVQDASQPGTSYGLQLFDIPQQEGPFSLEFPLDSFGIRGGGTGRIDYQRIYRVTLSISPTRFTDIDEIDFSTAVERVRIARAIPEPASAVLACLASVAASWFLIRKGELKQ